MGFDYETFLKAITSHYNASALLVAAADLYLYVANPQGLARPYVTYQLIDATTIETMSDTSDFVMVQFDVWSESKSPLEVTQIGTLLMDAFDWTNNLVVAGMPVISVRRVSQNVLPDPDDGYRMTINYEIRIQE